MRVATRCKWNGYSIPAVSWVLLAALVGLALGNPACNRSEEPDFTRLMNLGKAYLENRDSKKALRVLRDAVELEPESAPALRNLARAFRLAGKHEDALTMLDRAEKVDPESVATSYLQGLTLVSLARFEDAVPRLEEAVRRDPHTAALRFQLAGVYETTGQFDRAAEQLRETVRLDPLHASAQYKLESHARRAGDAAEMRRRHREFMRLRKLFGDETRNRTALEQCAYTRPEPAPVPDDRALAAAGAEPVIPVRFTDVTERMTAGWNHETVLTVAVLDVDEAGRCTIFAAEGDGGFALLERSLDGRFKRTAIDLKLPGRPRFRRCAVGDFHNDVPEGVKYDPKVHAMNDVVLSGPDGVRLLKRTGPADFRDVTEDAGLGGLSANRARWVDYEHDGDLDLVLARESGLEVWQNNGNGRFEQVTRRVGIEKTGSVADVVAVDLDANVAVDLVAARGAAATLVFENQRAGRFARMPEPPGPWPAADSVLADDLNNDGFPDCVLIGSAGGKIDRAGARSGARRADDAGAVGATRDVDAQRDAGGARELIVLLSRSPKRPRMALTDFAVAGGTLFDFDNDGWLDVCVFGAKSGGSDAGLIRLFRNVGGGMLEDVGEATGFASLSLPPIGEVIPADLDGDGDIDLLVVASGGGLRVLRNEGGNANDRLALRLTTLKTNPTGLGTHLEVRKGSWWVTRTVKRLPIRIGLGNRKKIDSLQVVWTNGVVDNRIDVEPTPAPLTLVEKNVAVGSCPFLYAWDGSGFRFVTDLLGNAPIGLPLARDVMLPADPDEIVWVGGDETFRPRGGQYAVVVTDEFREVLYLDQAMLLAVDHPADVEVHPTDKLMPAPFPRSETWAMGSPRLLVSAVGSDGIDRTEAIRAMDGVFAPPGSPLPPPYRGMGHPLSITLDFGPLEAARPLVLALTGWLQYGDASTNIALSQNSDLTIIPPRLEVENTGGDWHPVEVTVGMPAGKTKTILVDLSGKIPVGARRLRLTTTFEIRWDRIALFERRSRSGRFAHRALPLSAELAWRGFSRIAARAPGHPTTPAFEVVSDRPPWRIGLAGWCTRYGDVRDLVTARDDRLVVMNSGDALTLRFDASDFPPVPEGLQRTFFFYCVGWDKDGDHNVRGGAMVEPLPRGMPETDPASSSGAGDTTRAEDDWRVEYNTRWVSHDMARRHP